MIGKNYDVLRRNTEVGGIVPAFGLSLNVIYGTDVVQHQIPFATVLRIFQLHLKIATESFYPPPG